MTKDELLTALRAERASAEEDALYWTGVMKRAAGPTIEEVARSYLRNASRSHTAVRAIDWVNDGIHSTDCLDVDAARLLVRALMDEVNR